ncbi:MAG: hypothetical protein SLAVMIC_00210 [uncultured marine phage]|uniref:Uncharacterized protein n=1 Tax=uncultured marine phage TaxID=707152 RepID=A0A8D9FRY4_9VIRU|nr:MAG: hypothetical protein SLAVMIC_00210 [uncultured marine phage]
MKFKFNYDKFFETPFSFNEDIKCEGSTIIIPKSLMKDTRSPFEKFITGRSKEDIDRAIEEMERQEKVDFREKRLNKILDK